MAIGGITVENCRPVIAAGADFLAVAGGVWNHKDGPGAAVRAFNEIFLHYLSFWPPRLILVIDKCATSPQRTGSHSTSSMCRAPVASMTSRSKPSATPAQSGRPWSRAARKSASTGQRTP